MSNNHVIDLIDDDSDDDSAMAEEKCIRQTTPVPVRNPYLKKAPPQQWKKKDDPEPISAIAQLKIQKAQKVEHHTRELQAGVVFEEDHFISPVNANMTAATIHAQQQDKRIARGEIPLLYHDPDFKTVPSSIEGMNKKDVVTCRCRGSRLAKLAYKTQTGKPYYSCNQSSCNFFKWAFAAEQMQWYRFGSHTDHVIVSEDGFSANDLLQGKVGDCWFLSALAVVAERPDLILRLFQHKKLGSISQYGTVQVNLFQDGYWKTFTMDNFLPCLIDEAAEQDLKRALHASVGGCKRDMAVHPACRTSSSNHDPFAIADSARAVLNKTNEFLERDTSRLGGRLLNTFQLPRILERPVTSQDLAYSKAKGNQLWVQFVEKAYAKSHGCYQAISGGHIAEAFLDLTGAPTLSFVFEERDFDPRSFWYKLLHYRKQQLPMGCSTSNSAVGIIGMHAYSILDVQEVSNIEYSFFQETGVAHGNVSGFTDFDGIVRLLRIRNPHGKGEWKGDFSDKSVIWEKLLRHQQRGDAPYLHRTMMDDGSFWIDYDNFLMAFHSADVVLAFLGNHAKSFTSNFPAKKSNHRCERAFEISLLNDSVSHIRGDTVELYILGIQKTRRGASRGRTDRKKSYKPCDLGVLVAEMDDRDEDVTFTSVVKGKMFGLARNDHFSVVLNRHKNRRVIVMPISFGHPAATDKDLSFVLRFVSDAPLFIRELSYVPRMDLVMQSFCLSRSHHPERVGMHTVLLQDMVYRLIQIKNEGTIFLYLVLNNHALIGQGLDRSGISFTVQAECRGMLCRTELGLQQHETIAKGKKFQAAWRRYKCDFFGEKKSRLLLVLVQSGQDMEFNSIVCSRVCTPKGNNGRLMQTDLTDLVESLHSSKEAVGYEARGIFSCVDDNLEDNFPPALPNAGSAAIGTRNCRKEASNDTKWEQDLRRATIASENGLHGEVIASYEDDVAKAIQLSLQHKNQARRKNDSDFIVDLTKDDTPIKRRRTNGNDADLTTDKKEPASIEQKRRLARDAAMKRIIMLGEE